MHDDDDRLRDTAHEHPQAGRLSDTLPLLVEAIRRAPDVAAPRFRLGEILWHIGRTRDAIEAWSEAARVSPSHRETLLALANAFSAIGDFTGAADATARLAATGFADADVRTLDAMLRTARGDIVPDALLEALHSRRDAPLALVAACASRLLAANDDNGGIATAMAGSARQAVEALLDIAATRAFSLVDLDWLRVLAQALSVHADRVRADVFTVRYVQACAALHRNPFPLLWPCRTAGDAPRIGVLLDASAANATIRLPPSLVGVVRWTAFCIVEPSRAAPARAGRDERDVLVQPLPRDPGHAARALAMLDLDVVIDAAGVEAAYGPVLARRPARALWAVRHANRPVLAALVDQVVDVEAEWRPARAAVDLLPPSPRWVERIVPLRQQVHTRAAAPVTASELASRWETAVRAHGGGDAAAAKAGYEFVAAVEPDHAPAHYLRGILARDQGDMPGAIDALGEAVRTAPRFVDAQVARIDAMLAVGDAEAAARAAREAIAERGDAPALFRALGHVELKRGEAAAAARAFGEVLASAPDDAEAHYNQGVALQMSHELVGAAEAYRRSLALQPQSVDARFNLGVIHHEQRETDAAIERFSQVLAIDPRHVPAYKALAEACLGSGRLAQWFENFARFERNCPRQVAVAVMGLEVAALKGDFADVERRLDALRAQRFEAPDDVELLDATQQLLYLLLFFDVERELLGRYAHLHDRLARRLHGEPRVPREARAPGKLRIGYLSGDFRNHVMGKMMLQLLRHHDRDRFEIFGYATVHERDAMTQSLAPMFTRFASVGACTDRAAAAMIARDDLDVLVDLSTHTKGSRPGILVPKPARVQVTHVASAGATALSAIDFKLTDACADVEWDRTLQIEAPLVMEGCVYPWRDIDAPAAPAFSKTDLGLAEHDVVMAAFSVPMKLSKRCMALWRTVLAAIPHARLAFSPLQAAFRATYLDIARAAGIDARRIVFLPQGRNDAENQARYRLVDFVLDPMPYGGVNGTLEALAMAVPVVTLVGTRHSERTTFSMLTNLGVTDTIALSEEDYVAIAVRLAADASFMQAVRDRIRAGLASSKLTDIRGHTRHLEQAYVEALELRAPEALVDAARTSTARRAL